MAQNPEEQIGIELSNDVAQGVYSNLAVISHSKTEVVLDYVQLLPGSPKGIVRSRIIMTPEHAKRLLAALHENVRKYESQFGEISLDDNNSNNGGNTATFRGNGTKGIA